MQIAKQVQQICLQTVEFNFGPHFAFPPPADAEARPACQLAKPKEEEAPTAALTEGSSALAGDGDGQADGAGADGSGLFGDPAATLAAVGAEDAGFDVVHEEDEDAAMGAEGNDGEDDDEEAMIVADDA